MAERGIIYELADGRRGIAYARQQGPQFGGRVMLKIVDKKCNPIISTVTKKQAVKLEFTKFLKLIGFVD